MVTTIQVEESLKSKLDKLKIHRRETYNDLLLRLINSSSPRTVDRESLIETIEVLSDPEMMRGLFESIQRFEQGERGISFEELKKKWALDV